MSNSERHQAALTKQVEANKVLDNDLKMMCACVTVTRHAMRHTAGRYRKHKKDTAELEDKYKRDDYGRRYACVPCRLRAFIMPPATHGLTQLRHKPT